MSIDDVVSRVMLAVDHYGRYYQWTMELAEEQLREARTHYGTDRGYGSLHAALTLLQAGRFGTLEPQRLTTLHAEMVERQRSEP